MKPKIRTLPLRKDRLDDTRSAASYFCFRPFGSEATQAPTAKAVGAYLLPKSQILELRQE